MKRPLARFVAVAAALAVAVTGAVPGAAAEPRGDAVAVRHLQDTLTSAADAGDVVATDAALAELDQALAELSDGSRELATPARDETAAARDQLADQFPDGARTVPGVPTLPEALNMLLQKLLQILSELIDNLLGGGIPIPA